MPWSRLVVVASYHAGPAPSAVPRSLSQAASCRRSPFLTACNRGQGLESCSSGLARDRHRPSRPALGPGGSRSRGPPVAQAAARAAERDHALEQRDRAPPSCAAEAAHLPSPQSGETSERSLGPKRLLDDCRARVKCVLRLLELALVQQQVAQLAQARLPGRCASGPRVFSQHRTARSIVRASAGRLARLAARRPQVGQRQGRRSGAPARGPSASICSACSG